MQILFAIGLLLLYDLIELPAAVLVGPDTEVSLNKADYRKLKRLSTITQIAKHLIRI